MVLAPLLLILTSPICSLGQTSLRLPSTLLGTSRRALFLDPHPRPLSIKWRGESE